MRRIDREVSNSDEIAEIMSRCEVVRLALNTDTVPYLLPLNFGMEEDGMTLYIHGAMTGTKYDIITKDNRASFEMDVTHGFELDSNDHECSIAYESVIGWGYLEELTEQEEKIRALDQIMAHYHAGGFPYAKETAVRTRVLRLRIRERTAKRRRKMV